MKRIIFAVVVLMTSVVAMAQEDTMADGSRVILPVDLQSCKVPYATPPIPESKEADRWIPGGNVGLSHLSGC